ncbi:MAG TPA: SIR2 family protein [Kineosporiaceae bacterium]|nr:SIR2 family protein [Kineosporiaceae bacterium]
MTGREVPAYLAGLAGGDAARLEGVNRPGVGRLRGYLAAGDVVAFLGPGASAPLYPPPRGVIAGLVEVAVDYGLGEDQASTLRALSAQRPEAVVEVLARQLGAVRLRDVVREALRVRRDPVTGRTWTPVQEVVCRCAFTGVVTTGFDPGIVDARIRVRPGASGTGFTSWTDDLGLDRWRTGAVFADDELPVLYAHGYHARPDEVVLAASDYRRAYAGRLSRVLADLLAVRHVVWVGFDFADHAITGILREVTANAGTRTEPGMAPRHVAVMPWDPAGGDDPQVLRSLTEIEYGADLILYPTPGGDTSRLAALLEEFTDPRWPGMPPSESRPAVPGPPPTSTAPIPPVSTTPTPPTSTTVPRALVPSPTPPPTPASTGVDALLPVTRVLLIGSSEFAKDKGPKGLAGLPAVAENLSTLAELLADPLVAGVPADRISVVADPSDADAVMGPLLDLARQEAELLLVYYAGHGVLHEGELFLALASTTAAGAYYNGLPARLVRDTVHNAVAATRVLIADCCYSGRLTTQQTDLGSVIDAQLGVRGLVTLASSARDATSLSPEGEPLTAFTGELVDIFTAGIPDPDPVLRLDRVFAHLDARLRVKHRPEPRMISTQLAASVAIARNRAHPTLTDRPGGALMHEYEFTPAPDSPTGLQPGPGEQSLDAFLKAEAIPGVRVDTRPVPTGPDAMGTTEIVTALVSSGAATTLATAVVAWVRIRSQRVKIRIKRAGDGAVLDFDASGPTTIAALEAFLNHDTPGPDPAPGQSGGA